MDASSLQSQHNLIHVIESEKYTPSQLVSALQTALDDGRSFHFDKVILLPRVQRLAETKSSVAAGGGEAGNDSEDATGVLILELLQLFASGNLAGYLTQKAHFAPIMADFPQRLKKLQTICLRQLRAALDDPDVFDYSDYIDLLEHPACATAFESVGSGTEAKQLLELLDLFAFRTMDSKEFTTLTTNLTDAHVHKLRMLSLASYAAESKTLTYTTLRVRCLCLPRRLFPV